MTKRYIFLLISVGLFVLSCSSDDDGMTVDPPDMGNPEENGRLHVDLSQVPYPNLSDYGFFTGALNLLDPVGEVIPYDIDSPLFSDYASKERFFFIPVNSSIEYVDDFTVLDFPVGSVLIKNFLYYNDLRDKSLGRKIVETRLLVKKEEGWKPYTYKWNDEQTDATRFLIGGTVSASTILENGTHIDIPNYVIPRELDCRTCHNLDEKMTPIGPKPSNLTMGLTNNPNTSQLGRWANLALLSGLPDTVHNIPSFLDDSLDPLTRGRSYLDANCAYCHRQGGTANANGLFVNYDYDGSDLNKGFFKIPTNYNAPSLQYDIVPGDPDQSIMWYRMTQTMAPDIMPQIGRSVNDSLGIEIVREYILNLE